MTQQSWRIVSEIRRLKESSEEPCCLIRDADNFVCCLAVELEIELGLGSIIVPVEKTLQLTAAEAPLSERSASNGDADPRPLPGHPTFFRDCFCRSDDAARNETWPAFVLAPRRQRLCRRW